MEYNSIKGIPLKIGEIGEEAKRLFRKTQGFSKSYSQQFLQKHKDRLTNTTTKSSNDKRFNISGISICNNFLAQYNNLVSTKNFKAVQVLNFDEILFQFKTTEKHAISKQQKRTHHAFASKGTKFSITPIISADGKCWFSNWIIKVGKNDTYKLPEFLSQKKSY